MNDARECVSNFYGFPGKCYGEEPSFDLKTMVEKHDELCFTVVKDSYDDTVSCFKENDLSEKVFERWKGHHVLLHGVPGVGKTCLLNRLIVKFESQGAIVSKVDDIAEIDHNFDRHFNNVNTHGIILIDNVKNITLLRRVPNTTVLMFSRTLSLDHCDCVIEIKGLHLPKNPTELSWSDGLDAVCVVPFLYTFSKTLSNQNNSLHEIYLLLLASYVNYCQTLSLTLYESFQNIPKDIENFLRQLSGIAYACSKNNTEYLNLEQLLKLFGANIDYERFGVVTKVKDGRWKFTFEGMPHYLAAFKLHWDSEEQHFARDTAYIKLPSKAMKLFKGKLSTPQIPIIFPFQ